jgi:hypothetical protein
MKYVPPMILGNWESGVNGEEWGVGSREDFFKGFQNH